MNDETYEIKTPDGVLIHRGPIELAYSGWGHAHQFALNSVASNPAFVGSNVTIRLFDGRSWTWGIPARHQLSSTLLVP